MEKDWIPIPYKIILERIFRNSYEGEIEVRKVRTILATTFRMGKCNVWDIFQEMKRLGWIEFQGHKKVILLIEKGLVN